MSMQPGAASTLTSDSPARPLPGNGMCDYLWRGKIQGLRKSITRSAVKKRERREETRTSAPQMPLE